MSWPHASTRGLQLVRRYATPFLEPGLRNHRTVSFQYVEFACFSHVRGKDTLLFTTCWLVAPVTPSLSKPIDGRPGCKTNLTRREIALGTQSPITAPEDRHCLNRCQLQIRRTVQAIRLKAVVMDLKSYFTHTLNVILHIMMSLTALMHWDQDAVIPG